MSATVSHSIHEPALERAPQGASRGSQGNSNANYLQQPSKKLQISIKSAYIGSNLFGWKGASILSV